MKPQVIIIVEGGVVHSVLANTNVDVCVKEFDQIEEGQVFDAEFDFPVSIYTSPKLFQKELWADVDKTT